ncbi:MAG: cell division protein FtsQ/DivIB [Ectothiorhodospiraceae bacterium]|nr:cell division protein FtsQ/DivIB [Ectothiorhodospiraceae bacterium]
MKGTRLRRGARPLQRRKAAPDPARRARRREALARTGRIAGIGMLLVVVVGSAGYGVRYLTSPDTFPLQAVHFDSRLEKVRESDLRDALEGRLNAGFWGLDVEDIRNAIEDLSWVRDASVRRVWPGTLRITIREQEAVAIWNGEALMNPVGDLFSPDEATWPEGLPRLHGPDGRAYRVSERYREFDRAFGGTGKAVVAVSMDARESWQVTLDGGAEVKLGRQEVDARVQRFVRAWPAIQRRQSADLASADLRYPNGFALRWAQRGE